MHVITIILAVLLFIVWVYTLGTGLKNENVQTKAKEDLEPLSALKDNFISGYKSIQEDSSNIITE